jgi:transposase
MIPVFFANREARMRKSDERSGELFSYVDLEDRVPAGHPLRLIRRIVNEVLAALDGEFTKLYADSGRPSIAPERLLRALLLQVFYTIRSERQLMEQLHYNLLYRWFVGLGIDEPVWVPTVFTKNRERLLKAEVAHKFLAELLNHKEVRGLLSDEHFSVDGTQVAAWASMKSFRAKDGSDEPPSSGRNGERDFHGETRSNDTHASTTDPEARLYRKGKGKEAKLSYIGNALTENRHGLVVEAELGPATGTIEREAAMSMVVRHSPGSRRLTLGADKAYDVHEFVDDLRDLNVTPHIAQNTTNRSSAIDARTTHHPGYAISQQKRKRTEEPFGWAKMIGGFARPMLRGAARLRFKFTFTMAAYDLIRLPKLLGADERHVAHNGIHTCRARHRHRPAVLAIATHGPANTHFSNLLVLLCQNFWGLL